MVGRCYDVWACLGVVALQFGRVRSDVVTSFFTVSVVAPLFD